MVSRSHALRTDEDMPYRISNTIDTLDVHGTTDGGRGDNMHIYIYLVFYVYGMKQFPYIIPEYILHTPVCTVYTPILQQTHNY